MANTISTKGILHFKQSFELVCLIRNWGNNNWVINKHFKTHFFCVSRSDGRMYSTLLIINIQPGCVSYK